MTTTEGQFVSICLLTYNRAKILTRSIDSLLAQTHANFELILNDDNSPDETESVCRQYESRDPRVRYCRNPINLRYAGNQNAALNRARSEYVAIVHDGDIYRSDLIEKWLRALVLHPTAALAFCARDGMNEEGETQVRYRNHYGALVVGEELLDEMLCSPSSPIFGIVMVRKTCVESVGPFDPRFPTLADVDMWMRLLARHDAAYVSESLFKAAAREQDHPNRTGNWRVREEYALIYKLNFRRRYPLPSPKGNDVRRRINAMLRRQRMLNLAWCLKHLRFRALLEGLRYCWQKPEAIRWQSPRKGTAEAEPMALT